MNRTMLLACAITLMAGNFAMGALQIASTKHNFSVNYAWAEGQICRPCHTPHHAQDATVSSDLWNHTLSTATYVLNDGSDGSIDDMDRVSRLCLGCHDGTVALDAFGIDPTTGLRSDGTPSNKGSVPGAYLTTAGHGGMRNNLGTDFQDDHPVGKNAPYPALGTATSSFKAATLSGTSYTVNAAARMSLATEGASYVVGCKTCHNPHGSGATDNNPYPYLLRVPPADLCLTCHNK